MSKPSSQYNPDIKVFIDKNLTNFTPIKASLQYTGSGNRQTHQQTFSNNAAPAQVTVDLKDLIEKDTLPYFKGLIGLDHVFDEYCKNLAAFLHQSEESAMLNLWSGKSMTGKTQLAKRLSGLEGSFKMFSIKGNKTFYLDAYQIKDQFEQIKKDLLDKTKFPNNSVIFIDEVEKLFDVELKVVDESFVRKIRKFFEDLSSTRKHLVIFMTQQSASRSSVEKLFDTKLTSLMDFDIRFPEWTKENLVRIIFDTLEKKGYTIEPLAAAEIAEHCLKHGLIVELNGVIKLLEVELKHAGEKQITTSMTTAVLKNRS